MKGVLVVEAMAGDAIGPPGAWNGLSALSFVRPARLYSGLKRTLPTHRTDDRTQVPRPTPQRQPIHLVRVSWPFFVSHPRSGPFEHDFPPQRCQDGGRCALSGRKQTHLPHDSTTVSPANATNPTQPDAPEAAGSAEATVTFDDLGLAAPIAQVLAKRKYTTPTPIQALAIPAILEGRDVFGCAQTGTGKTAAFALPILHDLHEAGHPDKNNRGKRGRAPRALVLCPTRELAVQIFDAFVAYGRNLPLRHTAIYGGVGQYRQEKALHGGVDVLIATPGRLMDLHQQGLVDLGSIEVLVLDEADRMLDMGFLPDMRRIAALTPDTRQTLLFSATASKAIKALANGLLKDPEHLETTPESTTVERINQQAYVVSKDNKALLLGALLMREGVGRTLVFTKTKHGADRVAKALDRSGVRAEAIHGNKTQNARTRALDAFKRNAQGVLVATDVASRGIDVSGITHVINYDMPGDAETYVHRVGRTARAGASGIAITFCEKEEVRDLADVERRTKADIQPGDTLPSDLEHIAEPYQRPARKERPSSMTEHKPGGRGGRGGGGYAGGRGGSRGGPKSYGGKGGGPRGQRSGGKPGGKPGGHRGKVNSKPGGKPGGHSGGPSKGRRHNGASSGPSNRG